MEPRAELGRPIQVRTGLVLVLVLVPPLLAGCGGQEPATTGGRSAIVGRVLVGPRCPVETGATGCRDEPAAGSTVTVARRPPVGSGAGGRVVARTRTGADGGYRVAVGPGTYVVTADAGRSCRRVRVRVASGVRSRGDITCDSGIR